MLLEISQSNFDLEALRRAARKAIYRKYVAAAYGYLGKGCRVQIPDCALASIRCQFRAPGCDCAPLEIVSCSTHGYVGYHES